jgi:hypothetical protein
LGLFWGTRQTPLRDALPGHDAKLVFLHQLIVELLKQCVSILGGRDISPSQGRHGVIVKLFGLTAGVILADSAIGPVTLILEFFRQNFQLIQGRGGLFGVV